MTAAELRARLRAALEPLTGPTGAVERLVYELHDLICAAEAGRGRAEQEARDAARLRADLAAAAAERDGLRQRLDAALRGQRAAETRLGLLVQEQAASDADQRRAAGLRLTSGEPQYLLVTAAGLTCTFTPGRGPVLVCLFTSLAAASAYQASVPEGAD